MRLIPLDHVTNLNLNDIINTIFVFQSRTPTPPPPATPAPPTPPPPLPVESSETESEVSPDVTTASASETVGKEISEGEWLISKSEGQVDLIQGKRWFSLNTSF